jgi:NADH dehydrogenase/NADH:ubiquinone oxidoreductase subunit G
MKIFVDNKELEVSGKRVLIEELREAGYDIPSLCYTPNAKHHTSCMICMVGNEANNQMIPSCSTIPVEGMRIDTSSDDVIALRRTAIELLLSEHKARCGGCESKAKCRVRDLALRMKAKWTRFAPLPPVEPVVREHVTGRLWFEPAKCIRCGLCVYNSVDGFTFKGRGFGMQVVIPELSKKNIDERIAELCPTGALYMV